MVKLRSYLRNIFESGKNLLFSEQKGQMRQKVGPFRPLSRFQGGGGGRHPPLTKPLEVSYHTM